MDKEERITLLTEAYLRTNGKWCLSDPSVLHSVKVRITNLWK